MPAAFCYVRTARDLVVALSQVFDMPRLRHECEPFGQSVPMTTSERNPERYSTFGELRLTPCYWTDGIVARLMRPTVADLGRGGGAIGRDVGLGRRVCGAVRATSYRFISYNANPLNCG